MTSTLLGLTHRFVIKSVDFTHKLLESSAQAITIVLIMVIPAIASNDLKIQSHCSDTELVVFSCQIKSSKKYLSICASKSPDAANHYVQYRFGLLGKREFEFPVDRTNSVERFKISHYFRAKVDRRSLIFTNSNTKYIVFSDFEGEERPPQKLAGVRIQDKSGHVGAKTLPCTNAFYDRLENLDDIVEPDPDSL